MTDIEKYLAEEHPLYICKCGAGFSHPSKRTMHFADCKLVKLEAQLAKAIETLTWIGNLEPETKRSIEELALIAISDAEVAKECLAEIEAVK